MNYITRSVVSWQEDQERKLKEVKKDNASAKNIQPLLKFLYFYEYSFTNIRSKKRNKFAKIYFSEQTFRGEIK